jgi:glycyl-tRNA synthetase beta chain
MRRMAAVKGFLKSAGLTSIEQAEKRDDKKGAYYMATIEKPGRATEEVVATIVPEIVRNFPWPKSMRWGEGGCAGCAPCTPSSACSRQGRAFDIDGIKSGKETRGHRFMAPEPFNVKGFEDYRQKLHKAKVFSTAMSGRASFAMAALAMPSTRSSALSRTKACSPRMPG